VTVVIDEDTEIKGELSEAIEIRVKGTVQGDESILAEDVKVLCPAGREDDRDEEGDEDDDGGGNGRRRGEGNRGGGEADDEEGSEKTEDGE
jgi:hypothetical protein